jgi:3-deoxy-D-arabino-heptulosonate 7-phosphate (DAHP) synthase
MSGDIHAQRIKKSTTRCIHRRVTSVLGLSMAAGVIGIGDGITEQPMQSIRAAQTHETVLQTRQKGT